MSHKQMYLGTHYINKRDVKVKQVADIQPSVFLHPLIPFDNHITQDPGGHRLIACVNVHIPVIRLFSYTYMYTYIKSPIAFQIE